jgi:hypothetical protein
MTCASTSASAQTASLASFFPSEAPPPLLSTPRCLLVGPATAGTSSLLFQQAYNRARHGLSTLYVVCGEDDSFATRPPARPRSLGDASDEDDVLLARIHLKYCATWAALREVLASLHLAAPAFAAGMPRGLIIDGLSALFAPPKGTSGSGADLSQHTPSPTKPDQQNSTMFLALALALAAHAADHLDQAAAVAAAAAAPPQLLALPQPGHAAPLPPPHAPSPPPDPTLLIVACTAPAPELELADRWRLRLLRASPAGRTPCTFSLSAVRGPHLDDLERLYYRLDRLTTTARSQLELLHDVDALHPLADQFGPLTDAARTPARAAAPLARGAVASSQPPLASAVF